MVARLEEKSIPVSDIACRNVYIVWVQDSYFAGGCTHFDPERIFNIYESREVAKFAVNYINEN